MIEHRFHPTRRFSLTIIVPAFAVGVGVGVGLGILDDSRSDLGVDLIAAGIALFVCALLVIPSVSVLRWYGKVLVDGAGVSARDTLGRWRTVSWESLSTVRRVRLLGLPCILLSSAESRWSLWLAGSLEPREALLVVLSEAGSRAAAIRAAFANAA